MGGAEFYKEIKGPSLATSMQGATCNFNAITAISIVIQDLGFEDLVKRSR